VARLVLGDDHILFLDALSTVLSQHGHAVGTVARSAAELVAQVRRDRPDACLLNRQAAAVEDVEMISRVRGACAGTRVLMLSANPGSEAAGRAIAAGASGYLHQSEGIGALVSAIERVLLGEVVIGVPKIAPSWPSTQPDQEFRLAAHLTSRERECLMMLVEGLDTGAIMRRLGVSRTTVRTHLQSVLTKLGVHSRLEAVCFAVRHRLTDVWPDGSAPAAARSLWRPQPFQAAAGAAAGVIGAPVGAPAASVNGAPAASVNGAPAASVKGAPAASVNGAPVASVNGAPVASVNGAPVASVNGAPAASLHGAPAGALADEPLTVLPSAPAGAAFPAQPERVAVASAGLARLGLRRPGARCPAPTARRPGGHGRAASAWQAWVVIVRIGVDVAEIARVEPALHRALALGQRLFAQGERAGLPSSRAAAEA
jgi:two-component system, NarL family, nitrate/nitrite response regulator NarL